MVIIANERVYDKERKTAQKYIELDLLKKDVVNTTTHEIRTPLTIIQAASILLEQKTRMPNSEKVEMYQKITQQCERINQIVEELFETSKLEDGQLPLQLTPIALPVLTDEVIHYLHYDPNKIHFKTDYEGVVGNVRADRSSLYKILRNLMDNAVKYSPDGGTLEITVKNLATTVLWQIKDQGVGIPAEDLEKIFDKFYRAGASTTRRFRGLGLGLYIVKKNVELNAGKISVQSTLGIGSTFILELPKA
jgi:signal transduction histidine kinase